MKSKLVFGIMVTALGVTGALTISAQEATTQAASTTAQATSQWGGVYTAAQADRGQAVYETKCANCHLKSLFGHADDEANPPEPALTGEEFWKAWEGSTVAMLYDKIKTTMPRDDPGALKPQDAADIVAHILRVGKAPAGTAELPTSLDALNKIKLVEKKP